MAISKAFLDRLYEGRDRSLAEVKRMDAERHLPQCREEDPVKNAIADTREKLIYQMRVDDAEDYDQLIALYLETHGQQSAPVKGDA